MSLNKRIDPKNMSNNELDNYLLKNSTFFKTDNIDKNNIKKNISNPIRTNTNSLEITNSQNSNYLNNINNTNNNINEINNNINPYDTIKKLEIKNNELTFDIQRLIYLTDQNKGELLNTIKNMKLEKNELINKIHSLTSKLIEKDDIIEKINIEKNEIINQNLILKNKYENEIKNLNCEMNNYKLKLNYITMEYQNVLENFHKLKQEVIFEQKKDLKKYILEENKSDSINLLNINNNTNNNNNINQIENSFILNNIKNKEFNISKNINKNNLSKSTKKSNILNNSKYSSNSFDKSKTPKSKNNIKNKRFLHKNKKINSNNLTQSSLKSNNSHKINSEPNNIFFNEEILNLEKKLAQLNISYQTYLKEIQNFPNQNFKENKELKITLNFLENSIKETNDKLEKLKEKQQMLIIHSKSNK